MEYDEDTDSFLVRTAYGTSEALVAELRATTIRRDSTLVGRAATERRPLWIADLSTADLPAARRLLSTVTEVNAGDLGVVADVVTGGTVSVDDEVSLLP